MGSVFKKVVTRPLPTGAEIVTRQGVRLARWRDGRNKIRTVPLTVGKNGADRIRDESNTYFARYRDGNGMVIEAPTRCRDESAARQVLADLERKAERVRAGLISPAEARTAEHLSTPIVEHVAAFIESMQARSVVKMHRDNTRRHLECLIRDCEFARLTDLKREALERWLAVEIGKGRSARSRNAHHTALVSFVNWCVQAGRLVSNPFQGVPKANEAADPRRRRRSMTEAELARLLDVARRRPLLDALTVRRGKRKGETVANVRPEVRDRLEAIGRERALIYKTMVLTGLRKGELASLTVGQLRLDDDRPHLELEAADAKNRQGVSLPLRDDLAADLAQWLADRLERLRDAARNASEPISSHLPAEALLFDVPSGLVRIFDRDLKAAGISKRDERGRTLDVHALRTTFGTLLSRGGVPLRTAQAAMRHSDPKLTANVYTDPKLLDIHGALDALPSLKLPDDLDTEALRATGTTASDPSFVAPLVALTHGNEGQTAAMPDKMNSPADSSTPTKEVAASGLSGKEKGRLTTRVKPALRVGATGFEPATSRPPV
ncbi:site-specific integrase [soil metagenome]